MIGKIEFSKLLMAAWYKGLAGDWAKDMALAIQEEAFIKIMKRNELVFGKSGKKMFKLKKKRGYDA